MRNFLFELTSNSGQYLLVLLEKLRDVSLIFIAWLGNNVIWIVANIFKMLLGLIDHERMEHAEQASEQFPLTREIELLSAISAVKEDALAQRSWTSDHSEALNILGTRLANECDWEEKRIHKYFKRIVESIPGLQYAGTMEDDDDEEIEIG